MGRPKWRRRRWWHTGRRWREGGRRRRRGRGRDKARHGISAAELTATSPGGVIAIRTLSPYTVRLAVTWIVAGPSGLGLGAKLVEAKVYAELEGVPLEQGTLSKHVVRHEVLRTAVAQLNKATIVGEASGGVCVVETASSVHSLEEASRGVSRLLRARGPSGACAKLERMPGAVLFARHDAMSLRYVVLRVCIESAAGTVFKRERRRQEEEE